jgi:amino acid adenylation domain-containing protein
MEGPTLDSAALLEIGDSCVGRAPAISPTEYDQVIRQFNSTAVALPENSTVHGCFEQQVERTPQAIALVFGRERLTYAQLSRKANQVAHELLALGVRSEDRVGVYAERGIEMVIGMLAVLKAGCAYVPLDPSYPSERLTFMSNDSSLVAILTTATLARQLPMACNAVILLNRDLAHLDTDPCVSGLTARNLAYVIYTSGSTGLPKGVLVEHRGVLRLVVNASYAQIRTDDCVAHCATPSFDAATWEVWGPLLNGASLLIVPQRVVLSPSAFRQTLLHNSVTVLFLTVGLFNEYADALELAFAGMRHLLVGGDRLVPSIVGRTLAKDARPQQFLNVYGPTEATAFATTFKVTCDERTDAPLPIGKPISNTQIYILDDDLSPVPIGVPGEIFIGGQGVARGYLGRPELSAERFIPDPFSDMSSELLYRTGDLGCWRADGNVEFLRRRDSQLKIRGFRVEPEEIETTLQSHSSVKQALVIARESNDGLKHLIAYLVPDDSPVAPDHLVMSVRDHLTDKLPPYMVPAAIVVLDKFPLTHSGKVDKNALPAPHDFNRPKQAAARAETAAEKTLAEIWEQVLNQTSVDADDNFFELGGDSMMGLELIAKISERLTVEELSVIDLFEHPTVRDMAQFVETLNQTPQNGFLQREPGSY